MYTRNHRDKYSTNDDDNQFIRKMYYNSEDRAIATLQLLDKIHCFFMHTT